MVVNLVKLFSRKVSTVSPLTAAFNRLNPKKESFPKLFDRHTGLFNYDSLREPTGFFLFKQNALIDAEFLVKEALSNDRNRKMVEVFDQLSNSLCKVADMAEFVRVGHPQQNFAHFAEEASIAISAEVEVLNTNKELYDKLLNVVEKGDCVATTPLDDYVAKLFLFDFEQSGIHLNEQSRKSVVKLNEHILHVGSYFMNSTCSPRTVAKSNLPEELRDSFHSDGNNIIVTGLFNDSDNERVREAAYRIYLYPEEHQERLLTELLMSRLKLASICGFKSYAHRAINGSIANNPETVWQLIDKISENLRPLAAKDIDTMLRLKASNNRSAKTIKPWDVPYYTTAFKQTKYSECIAACAPYFSLGSCMDGLNLIFKSLFNVKLEISETINGELWHRDVIKLQAVETTTNTKLGFIYCDFFERNSKPHHDCHFTIQGGCRLSDGSYQPPIVVLMLSLPNPTPLMPSLLTPNMVDNLFHEMGHAMHSMIARTPYQHITGTRCSTDLAEVPSILMEYFASDSRVVSAFARHFQTEKEIPEELLNSWLNSKRVFMASDIQLQVFYSALDQAYHSSDPLRGMKDTTQVLSDIQNNYYSLPTVENTAWQLRFGHLVGYGAKYYSYLVSKAVAAMIWKKLFQSDPFSSSAGDIYKREVLRHGGGKPPKEIISSVLGEEVSANLLSNSIIDHILEFYNRDNSVV